MLKKTIIVFAAIGLMISCEEGENVSIREVENGKKIISIDASWLEAPKDFQGMYEVEYIPLETNDEALIGSIDDVKVIDGLFFLLDKSVAKALFIYNEDGSFINKIVAIGQGPDEVNRINDFTINRERKELLISDLGKRRIFIYDFDGTLLRVERNELWFTSVEWLPGDSYLYYFSHYSVDENRGEFGPLVVVGDINGKVEAEYFKIDNRQSNLTVVENFNLSNNGNEILFSKKFDENLYSVNNQGELVSKVKVDFGALGIAKDYREFKVKDYRIFENKNPFAQVRSAYSTDSSYTISYTNPVKMNGLQIYMQAVISKNTTEGYLYLPTNNPDSDGVMLPSIKASDRNYFYGLYDADEFVSANNENDEVITKNHRDKRLLTIEESDNPILVKIRVKDEK